MSHRLYRWMAPLALCAASSAQAQFGLPDLTVPAPLGPSLEDCQDPDFIADAHALVEGMCANILSQEAARQLDAARRAGLLSITRTAAILDGAPAAASLVSQHIDEEEGAGFGLGGFRLPAWLGYELDGAEVSSCDEYVYQRYHTYHKYLQALDRADNTREAFELAFDEDGSGNIGHRYTTANPYSYGIMRFFNNAYRASDQVFDPIMPLYSHLVPDLGANVHDLPKNDFFALTDEELRMVRRHDVGLSDRLGVGQRYYRVRLNGYRSARYADDHPTPWGLHQQLDEALSDTPDVELEVLAGRREVMRKLVALRRSLRREGLSESHYRVRRVDEQIMDALERAEVDGCLDIDPALDRLRGQYDYNRCDWAPGDLAVHVRSHMDPFVEYARQQCEANFPGAHTADGYSYRSSTGRQYTTGQSPFDSANNMRLYLSRMVTQSRYYLSQFDVDGGASAGGNLPYWNRSYGDSWSWGDRDWASAEFEYHADWGLSDGPVDEVCDINPQFDLGGEAAAYMFGRRREVLRAEAAFDLRRERRELDLAIFGYDYLRYNWERDGNATPRRVNYDFSRSGTREYSRDVEYCQQLVIAAIPVVVCAELAGRVGFDYSFDVSVDEQVNGRCNPQAEVSVSGKPFAIVDAVGSGGVGISGLGGGVYVAVNLLEMEVPAELNASLVAAPDGSNIEISVDGAGALELASLSGEIGGYVEFPRVCVPFTNICAGGRVSEDFFDWPRAIETEFDLFDFHWTLDMNTWISICDAPGIDCRG